MNRRIKIKFDEAGIEIPSPHRTLYFGTQASHSNSNWTPPPGKRFERLSARSWRQLAEPAAGERCSTLSCRIEGSPMPDTILKPNQEEWLSNVRDQLVALQGTVGRFPAALFPRHTAPGGRLADCGGKFDHRQ